MCAKQNPQCLGTFRSFYTCTPIDVGDLNNVFFHRRRCPKRLFERTSRTAVHAVPVPDALGRANCAAARRPAGKRQTDAIDSRLSAKVEQSTYIINSNY